MNNKTFKRTLSAIMISLFVGAIPVTALAYNGDDSDSSYETQTLYTTDWLRVRAEPSLDSEILDVKAPDTAITAIGYEGEWVKVWYNDDICYMHSDYLTMFESDDTDDSDKYNTNEVTYYTDSEYSPDDLYVLGVIPWNGYRFTWYSENVLPGGGLDIEGRYSDENGYICDGNGYICLASDSLEKGTIVDTPFGKQGKVYDTGCGADDILDVYVSW